MTDDRIASVSRLLAELGPVELSTGQMVDPRAFKHVPHPLAAHAAALEGVFREDLPEGIRDELWARLVAAALIPELGVPVTLARGAHNSAFAVTVDGLSANEDALPDRKVSARPELVAELCVDVLSGRPPAPSGEGCSRPSVQEAGLSALAGRLVSVLLQSGGEVSGRVLSVSEGMLALVSGETLLAVPFGSVLYLETSQLTADEMAASDPL